MAQLAYTVVEAFKNSKKTIPFVLEGAFKKHGNTPDACGSHFIKEGWYRRQEGVEHYLFGDLKEEWYTTVYDEESNLLIAEARIPEGDAVCGATHIMNLPNEQVCYVKSLGDHPTLVTKGEAQPTNLVTAIVYLDGGKDPDLKGMGLEGKPVLVTWHPGPSLPPSSPHNCEVGDVMTAEEAIDKGWCTVAFE
jgi:hypothetical protein